MFGAPTSSQGPAIPRDLGSASLKEGEVLTDRHSSIRGEEAHPLTQRTRVVLQPHAVTKFFVPDLWVPQESS